MHSSKTKFLKLALSSIVLAFFVVLLSVFDIFPSKIIPDVEAVDITTGNFDTCLMTDSLSGNFTKSGGSCVIKKRTGISPGTDLVNNKGDLILSNGASVVINAGAELILAPGAEIKLHTAGAPGVITLQTGGALNTGISRGYLCALDNDQDGYVNPSFTDFTKVLTTVPLATPCAAGYTEKGKLKSTTVYDCDDNSFSATNVCCSSGYRDYDKDGSGLKTDTLACYAPSASYNIVANNSDCDDGNAAIYHGWSTTSFCGVGTCGGSGTDSCTNGVRTNTCTTSPKACCNAVVGTYKAAGTGISTCLKCTGAQADPINQTSAEDINNLCTTGALGSATSCRAATCSGSGDSCGILASTAICNYGSYTAYSGASGACTLTSYRPIYKCSAGTCSGTSSGSDYQANQNANAVGNIWNGSAWTAATCALNTGYGSAGYYCTPNTAWNSVAQRLAYGCNTSGSLDTSTPKATCNQATCSNRTENGVSCSSGSCLANNCGDGIDNDSDGYIDTGDINCSAGGQCIPNSSCCDANGFYAASGTICGYSPWSGYGASAGSCITTRTRAIYACNASGTCSGTSSGTDYGYQYAATSGYVWNGSAWAAPTVSNYCGSSLSAYKCSGQQIYRSYNGCALGSNTCNVARSTNNDLCTGAENSMCVAGNSSCINKCAQTTPAYPGDDDGDGYTDAQDANCLGGVGQCKTGSGPCCDESNGSFKNTSTRCSTATCANGTAASGQCRTSYMTQNCSGASASCTGTTGTAYCNAPVNNNIWNGTAWVVSNGSIRCGEAAYNSCSGLYPTRFAYGCNTSGTCNTAITNGYVVSPTGASCADTNKVCLSGNCVQCISAAQCPADSWTAPYSCNGNWRTGTRITNSCTSNVCGSSSSVQNMTDCTLTGQICSGGACTSYCPASTVSGYSVPQLNYGASTSVTKAACYRSVGGSYTATATCNSGTIGITSQSGPNCFGGYQYVFGSWYQSTFGCYDVCVLSTCAAGSVGGYSYAQLNHAQVVSPTRAITNGSCTGNLQCTDGSVNVQNESCTCNFGYDWTGSACVDCTSDAGCATGYYCSLAGSPFSTCNTPAYNTCQKKCWNINQTVNTEYIKEGDVTVSTYVTGSFYFFKNSCGESNSSDPNYSSFYVTTAKDNPFCSGAPACPYECQDGGATASYAGSAASGDSCYKYNGLGLKYWVTRNRYKCYSNLTQKLYYGDACAPSIGFTSKTGTVTATGSCAIASYCGDWNCNANEDCYSCSNDCGQCQVCGDGYCTGSENEYDCYDDCGSGGYCNYDYYCDSGGGETCSGCSTDCGQCQVCGDGSCTGSETIYNCSSDCFTGSCGSGYRVSGNSCVACVGGTYKLGLNTATSCSTCSAGSYSYEAASSCTACSAGYYSSSGASSCTYCSAGTYNSGTGNSGCSTCPANYYCTGGTNLTSCGGSLVSPAGSTSSGACTSLTCGSGYYVSGGTCAQCSPGYYKLGTNSATSCSYCSAGTYNSGYANSSCTTCTANYYCTGGTNRTSCGTGYVSASGSTSSASCTLVTCGSGYYRSGSSCIACAAGTYKSGTNSNTSCTTCSAGTYNTGTANSSCTTCEARYYCTGGSSRSYCGSTYTSPAGSSSSAQCTYCGSGC